MTSSESTAIKLADPTLIEHSDLKIKVWGWAIESADPFFTEADIWGRLEAIPGRSKRGARVSKVIFAEDFHLLAQEWFSKGRTIERVIGL